MDIDVGLLERFEKGLNPQDLARSEVPAEVLGYGEISTVFKIDGSDETAYKRMPLFPDQTAAERYGAMYREYCRLLEEAGLNLPESGTAIVEVPGRPVVIYIAQRRLPADRFGHKLLHRLDDQAIHEMIEVIVSEISKVYEFNNAAGPSLELALDGQLSNWIWLNGRMYYCDTSTPLYRKNGVEQLDPELFLESAPSFLRWFIRLFFLSDVMERYYHRRQVFIDLAANLHKEQRPDLVGLAVEIINTSSGGSIDPITVEQVEKYYREDKFIWTLFLAMRRLDRWLKTNVARQRYEFILPGKIER